MDTGTKESITSTFSTLPCRTVHFYRSVLERVPMTKRKAVARMLKVEEVADELESMRLGAAARMVRDGFAETLAYTESRPSTGVGSGRTTGSSVSTARSGGGRGSSRPSQTATRPSCWWRREVHSGARVGQEEVPGHVQAGGDGRVEGKGRGRLNQFAKES